MAWYNHVCPVCGRGTVVHDITYRPKQSNVGGSRCTSCNARW
jgi:transcription elongation factor Elf1